MFDDLQVLASSEDREAWLAARRGGVTATDIARLASGGAKEWQKVREEKDGIDDFAGNMFTQWGNDRENIIGEKFNTMMGGGFVANSNVHSVNEGRYMATPDMIGVGNNALCQIKTALHTQEWNGVPPKKYYDQCQWEMLVMGADVNYLVVEWSRRETNPSTGVTQMAVAFPDQDPEVITIARSDKRIRELMEVADLFLSGGDTYLDGRLEAYTYFKTRADAAKQQADRILEEIREHIGPDVGAYKYASKFGSLTLSTPSPRVTVDSKRLKEEEPELFEKYSRTSKPRPSLTVKLPTIQSDTGAGM